MKIHVDVYLILSERSWILIQNRKIQIITSNKFFGTKSWIITINIGADTVRNLCEFGDAVTQIHWNIEYRPSVMFMNECIDFDQTMMLLFKGEQFIV